MLTRRELLARSLRLGAGAATLLPAACGRAPQRDPASADERPAVWVNDIHSGLNRTRVAGIERPASLDALQAAVIRAARERRAVSVMGGRHAMGGQQFGTGTLLLDTGGLTGITELDADTGQVEVGAGIQWPELITELNARQQGRAAPWGIVQKQTGADRLSLGGALAANVHGRGLAYRPIIQDVEAFTLVDAQGETRRCSRRENAELFRLAIGGYGLFGVIASVRLRLAPRRPIERVVEVREIDDVPRGFAERIADGYLFGDFQYATDAGSDALLRRGVFSCYRPIDPSTPVPETQTDLDEDDWLRLIALGHVDRAEAFERYSGYYLSTNGQTYWSDTHQLSTYIDAYHGVLGSRIGALATGTEMITEIYVPRDALPSFFAEVRADFVTHDVNLIYGTVRLIEADAESFLAWASEPWACVIFNLHTAHDTAALDKTAADFRRLIDRARAVGGRYFLTYHRWATREQVLACYPQFPDFLALKRAYDPEERFQSDWYRHYRSMLA